MFDKKCKRCGKKKGDDFDFCPYCGFDFRIDKKMEKERDYGFLGRDDSIDFSNLNIGIPFGFNKLFSSLLNQIDRQFKELDKEMGNNEKIPKLKPSGLSISISSSTGERPKIKIRGFCPEFKNLEGEAKSEQEEVEEAKIKKPEISDYRARKLAKLPKKEAETRVRRLSNRIVYEIELPGVKNLSDVIINKLENSIEIKAFSKNRTYFKLLPLNLPILNYKLEEEKLILELKAK